MGLTTLNKLRLQFRLWHARKIVWVQAKAGITDDIIEVLTATSTELSKGRRKRPMPPGLAAPGSFDHYKLLSSHPVHKTSEVNIPCICMIET